MKKILFSLLFSTLLPVFCSAQMANVSDVVINEVAWMGSTTSATDEWMELFNTTSKSIDVTGWTLASVDGKLKITLKGFIDANGYYLLERTDDNSVNGVMADVIYKGSLSNTGEYLKLYDSLHNLIDQASFASKWPAGNATTRQTMEKITDGWQTSKDANGTPRAQNSSGAVASEAPKTTITTKAIENPAPKPVAAPQPETKITYPNGISINEILPSPEGADETDEWIELKNSNTINVDISGWKLKDTQGTITTYAFPKDTIIAASGYLVVTRPETKILLNNEQDGVQLIQPDATMVDSVQHPKAPTGQSYNKTSSGWQWSTTLTAAASNTITKTITKAKTTLSKAKKSDNKVSVASVNNTKSDSEKNIFVADISNQNSVQPWVLFFTALVITIISGIIILIIKLKVFKNHVRS